MTIRKLQVFIFCIGMLMTHVQGQTKGLNKTERPNSIFFAPLNLLDPINPSLQIGYERMLNEKYAVQLEGAYIINHDAVNYFVELISGTKDCEYTNSGFKLRGEFKYFYRKKRRRRRFQNYLSCELFYLKNKSRVSDSFEISDVDFNYPEPIPEGYNGYNDIFVNDKQRYGLNVKWGTKFLIGKSFLVELHAGIGLVYRISKHYERDNINDKLFDQNLFSTNTPGKTLIPNIPANIKIGYRF